MSPLASPKSDAGAGNIGSPICITNWSPIAWVYTTLQKKKTKLRGLNPRANYTDRETALSAKLAPTLADKGCNVVSVTDPWCRIVGFLDRSGYFFFQVAPQLYLRG
jgi:hypothetical protein